MHIMRKPYHIARHFRRLKYSWISRIGTVKILIPGVCEWDHTVLAKSGQGLGVDDTAKILTAKILNG